MKNISAILIAQLLVFAILQLAAPASVDATGCHLNVPENVTSSDAVFLGRVIDLTPPDPASPKYTQFRFKVIIVWKGVTTSPITLVDVDSKAFEPGKRYLVYASRDPSSGRLFVPDLGNDCKNRTSIAGECGAGESVVGEDRHILGKGNRIVNDRPYPIPSDWLCDEEDGDRYLPPLPAAGRTAAPDVALILVGLAAISIGLSLIYSSKKSSRYWPPQE